MTAASLRLPVASSYSTPVRNATADRIIKAVGFSKLAGPRTSVRHLEACLNCRTRAYDSATPQVLVAREP